MRRFLLQVMLLLVFGGWCTQVHAGWIPGQKPVTKPTELVDGKYYYFRGAFNAAALNGVMCVDLSYQVNAEINGKHIFKLVFGDKNPFTNEQMFYLQSVETGKWFGGNGWTAETMEESKAITPFRASETTAPDFIIWPGDLKGTLPSTKEWIKAGGDESLPDAEIFEINDSYNKCPAWKWRSAEVDKEGGDALCLGVVASNYDGTQNTITWFKQVWGSSSYPVSFGSGRTGINAWYAYEAEFEYDPITDLEKLVAEYRGQRLEYVYRPGTDPGCIDQAVYDSFMAVFQKAIDFLEGDDIPTDEAKAEALVAELKAARPLLDEAERVPLEEGFYYIASAYPAFEQNQKIEWEENGVTKSVGKVKGMFDLPSQDLAYFDLMVATTNEAGESTGYRYQSIPQYMFRVTKSKTTEGAYDIQNALTGRFLNGVTKSGHKRTSTGLENSQQVKNGSIPGTYAIGNVGCDTYEFYHANAANSGQQTAAQFVVGWWDSEISLWRFIKVADKIPDPLVLDTLAAKMDSLWLKGDLQKEIDKAQKLIDAGYQSLITSADQLSGNANESTEGSLANLIDGNTTTYYHSAWSAEGPDENHYLQVALPEAVDKVAVKWYKRTQNNANRPAKITVMGLKDGGSWTEAAVMPAEGDTLPWGTATPEYIKEVVLSGGPYTTLRFVVDKTYAADGSEGPSKHPNKHPYFTFSEFNLYNGLNEDGSFQYRANSLAYREDMQEAYSTLKAAIELAKSQLATANQDNIDAMKAAIEAFDKAYPHTDILDKIITKAETYYEQALAADGDETLLGAYNTKSVHDALYDVVETAKADYDKETVSRAYIDEHTAKIQQAIDNFVADINMPKMDTWYYIVNQYNGTDREGEKNPYAQLVYAGGKDVGGGIKWGGDEYEGNTNATYLWRFVDLGNQTFAVQNFGTGYYMGANRGTSAQYLLSDTVVAFKFAYVAGGQLTLEDANYNPDEQTYRYIHAAAGNTLVTWDASQDSPSAWTFVAEDGSNFAPVVKVAPNGMDVLTFPFNVATEGSLTDAFAGDEVAVYELASATINEEGKITEVTLNPMDIPVGGISAGTPFIAAYPSETLDGEKAGINLNVNLELPLSTEAKTVNGMVGVLRADTAQVGMGFFDGDTHMITAVTKPTTISVQSGYINPKLITNQPAKDGSITLSIKDGGVLDNIQEAIKDANALVDVVDMSGVVIRKNVKKANALKGLNKGVYIVGGTKVSVK